MPPRPRATVQKANGRVERRCSLSPRTIRAVAISPIAQVSNVSTWCATHASLPSGGFCPGAHYQGLDKRLMPRLVHYFKTRRVAETASLGDFGAGGGWYSHVFNKYPWLTSSPFDYSPPPGSAVQFVDLSRPLGGDMPVFDFVLCLEVGEHVPKALEDVLLDNIVSRARRGIVLSWALPGQNGTGHVNERSNNYVIGRMAKRRWTYRPHTSFVMREAAKFWWFRRTIMVFEPETIGGDWPPKFSFCSANVDAAGEALLKDEATVRIAASEREQEAFTDATYASVRDPLEAAWIRLTRLLAATNRLPLRASQPVDDVHFWTPGCKDGACLVGGRTSIGRRMIDYWHAEQAVRVPAGSTCGELGDGHFVRERAWRARCENKVVFDKYNTIMRHALETISLDLDAPPDRQDQLAKSQSGTLDVLVAHQVFEHLARPSQGITNVNRLLKEGGRVVFSTPFLLLDQPSPRDYFRYTPVAVHNLLTCAGFGDVEVHGIGGPLTAIGYLSGMAITELDHPEQRLTEKCTHPNCSFNFYSIVVATGIKVREPSHVQVALCFG